MRIAGQQDRHLLGLVGLDSGRTAVVDLGPESELRRQGTRFRQDQWVRAIGTPGRLSGRPILIVDRLADGGRVLVIRPIAPQRLTQQTGRQARQGDQARVLHTGQQRGIARTGRVPLQMVQGRLVDTSDVTLEGLPDSHRLVKLETRQGQTVAVDLGTQDRLEGINLEAGDQVAAAGRLGRVNDRPVLFATHVADIVRIQRDDATERVERQQDRQQNAAAGERAQRQSQERQSGQDQQDRE